MEKRKAEVTLNKWWRNHLGIVGNNDVTVSCDVLGLLQYSECNGDGTAEAYPVFICELTDGRVIEVAPTAIKFIGK